MIINDDDYDDVNNSRIKIIVFMLVVYVYICKQYYTLYCELM